MTKKEKNKVSVLVLGLVLVSVLVSVSVLGLVSVLVLLWGSVSVLVSVLVLLWGSVSVLVLGSVLGSVSVLVSDEDLFKYYILGYFIGIIIGIFLISLFPAPTPINLGSGITLQIPANWSNNRLNSGCITGTTLISAPNGAQKQVAGPITCTIDVSNQTGFKKTFMIGNVPGNSTIAIRNFTNYTIEARK